MTSVMPVEFTKDTPYGQERIGNKVCIDDVSIEAMQSEYLIEVAAGNVSGNTYIDKFGEATEFDPGDGFVDVWDGVGDSNADNVYTFSTTADIDTLSSSNATDSTTILVEGLDSGWNVVQQTVTLSGQNKVTLATPLIRVYRMSNNGTTTLAGNVYCYVDGSITLGVPDVSNTIRAIIANGNNRTLMAIYTVPINKLAFIVRGWASLSGKAQAASTVRMWFRPISGVFALAVSLALLNTATSYIDFLIRIPEVFGPQTDIKISADTDAVNTGVSAGFDLLLRDIN